MKKSLMLSTILVAASAITSVQAQDGVTWEDADCPFTITLPSDPNVQKSADGITLTWSDASLSMEAVCKANEMEAGEPNLTLAASTVEEAADEKDMLIEEFTYAFRAGYVHTSVLGSVFTEGEDEPSTYLGDHSYDAGADFHVKISFKDNEEATYEKAYTITSSVFRTVDDEEDGDEENGGEE